jgi:hypothetical protein
MQEILEFGLFILVMCSPITIVWLMNEISDIIASKITKKK